MRIAAFEDREDRGRRRHGLVVDHAVHPLPEGTSVTDLLTQRPAVDEILSGCAEPVPLDDVALRAPIEPATIRDFMTFEEHFAGALMLSGRTIPDAWYEGPAFYFTNPHAVIGTAEPVPVPPGCELFDLELEVAAVIGRDGANLDPEEAEEHIVAYTIFNDWSARDLQVREMEVGLGPTKAKDTVSTLGPWLVTPDELEPFRDGDRFDLRMTATINGEAIGTDSLANMAWSFAEMAAYASRGTMLRAGDVLGSGTCGGGCLAELWGRNGGFTPPPLQIGDVVTLEVEGIGAISNEIVAGADPRPIPPARRTGDTPRSGGTRDDR